MTTFRGAKVILPDGVLDGGDVTMDGGKIVSVGAGRSSGEVVDAAGLYLAPGFIDMHTHGAGGADFMDGTPDAFRTALRMQMAHGATTVLPTTVAASMDELRAFYDAFARVKGENGLPDTPGAHMEGPFIAKSMKGALDEKYARAIDMSLAAEILAAANGNLLVWSLAPELGGAEELIRYARAAGVLVSAGHTDAQYRHMAAGAAAGMTMATHLYSGMSTIRREMGHRKLGAIESALLMDELYAEIIADGVHLPPELLRLIVKTKPRDKLILVTDSMRAAGMPEGKSIIGSLKSGNPVEVADGVAYVPDFSCFAGSVATCDRLVRVMTKMAGLPLWEAVRMITLNPARALGLSDRGAIAPGMRADIALFDEKIRIRSVYVNGFKTHVEQTEVS